MSSLIIPGKNATIIRVTERQTFKECRRRHFYEYSRNITKRDRLPGARELGTAIHAVLESYYREIKNQLDSGKRDKELAELLAWQTWVEQNQNLEYEQQELGQGMLAHYFEHYKFEDSNIKPRIVERRLYAKVPGTKNTYLTGKMDLILDISGELWVTDHKTLSQFYPSELMELKDQVTAYVWLARKNGINVRGGIYNMLLKKVPSVPKLLKSGEMSRNSAIVTTPKVYREACVEAGLNPADYEDFIFEMKQSEFFRRERIYRSKQHIDNFEIQLTAEVREMTSKNTFRWFHTHDWCVWCDFKSLCKAQNDGGDTESIIRDYYVENTERENVYPNGK